MKVTIQSLTMIIQTKIITIIPLHSFQVQMLLLIQLQLYNNLNQTIHPKIVLNQIHHHQLAIQQFPQTTAVAQTT